MFFPQLTLVREPGPGLSGDIHVAASVTCDFFTSRPTKISYGGAFVHEALTLWDIAYAEPLRRPEPNEQHVSSFL
jgi:hypothetical protein